MALHGRIARIGMAEDLRWMGEKKPAEAGLSWREWAAMLRATALLRASYRGVIYTKPLSRHPK